MTTTATDRDLEHPDRRAALREAHTCPTVSGSWADLDLPCRTYLVGFDWSGGSNVILRRPGYRVARVIAPSPARALEIAAHHWVFTGTNFTILEPAP